MTITASSSGTKGLILAPHGRDAAVALGLLGQAGIAAEVCADFETLQSLIDDETLFVVATNEAMLPGQVAGARRPASRATGVVGFAVRPADPRCGSIRPQFGLRRAVCFAGQRHVPGTAIPSDDVHQHGAQRDERSPAAIRGSFADRRAR